MTNHWENQPRDPAGTETGGQWTSEFTAGFMRGVNYSERNKYYNDGKPYLRAASAESPMSDWGHAMFADYRDAYFDATDKDRQYIFKPLRSDARVIDSESQRFQDAVKKAFREDANRGWSQFDSNDEVQSIIDRYNDGELSIEEVLGVFSPNDIVDSAEAYDSALGVGWLYNRVLEPNGWYAVITPDGAVVFDETMIERP